MAYVYYKRLLIEDSDCTYIYSVQQRTGISWEIKRHTRCFVLYLKALRVYSSLLCIHLSEQEKNLACEYM